MMTITGSGLLPWRSPPLASVSYGENLLFNIPVIVPVLVPGCHRFTQMRFQRRILSCVLMGQQALTGA